MKTDEALERIGHQLVETFAKPDMPPWDWRAVEEHVLAMIKEKYRAEITNRIHTLALPELTRFLKICIKLEKQGVTTTPPTPAVAEAKKEKEAIAAIDTPKHAPKAAPKGKK